MLKGMGIEISFEEKQSSRDAIAEVVGEMVAAGEIGGGGQ